MSHHLAVLAQANHDRLGDFDQVFFEGTWHTSGSLHERAARAAGGLAARGVAPGDRVVVLMMNTPEVFVSYRAIWRAGAVVTPVIFLQSPPELRHILTDSGAAAVIVSPEVLGLLTAAAEGLDLLTIVVDPPEGTDLPPGAITFAELEDAAPLAIQPREDRDMAALLYTGGTTGRSKGVMLSHEGLYAASEALHRNTASMEVTVSIQPLPLSHAFGMIVTVAGFHADKPTRAVLQRWFDPAGWLAAVETHRVENSPLVPSMLQMILAQPYRDHDLSSLRYCGSGASPLTPALRDRAERELGITVLEGYGCTESSAVVSAPTIEANRPGSVGKPLAHHELAILDPTGRQVPVGEDGEICIRGRGVMLGYWNDPEATARTIVDGWMHTGDIGHVDADGFLYVVDRVKDLIIRGGFNVYPRDVEDVLMEHEAVVAAAVVGVPDAEKGEEVAAVVALAPGAAVGEAELIEFAKSRLAAHKYPRRLDIVPAVPLTSVGKTNRKAVRELLAVENG